MTWRIKYKPDTRDHSQANYKGVDLWIVENQGKHFCQCGCKGVITIRPYMHAKSVGIPTYLPFHYFRTREYLIAQTELAKQRVGKKAHNWKHGKTKKQEILRKSKPYIAWRNSVFLRDDFTCQKCSAHSGQGKTVYLHAHHHKIPFKQLWEEFVDGTRTKESLFDPSLGLTLCVPCHKQVHSVN